MKKKCSKCKNVMRISNVSLNAGNETPPIVRLWYCSKCGNKEKI